VVDGNEDVSDAIWLPTERLSDTPLTPVAQEAWRIISKRQVGSGAAAGELNWRVDADLDLEAVDDLISISRPDGFRFVTRLRNDWLERTNRFNGEGETLIQVASGRKLVAIGGLNRDPYAESGSSGRLRRLYVHPQWRGRGLGRQLVMRLVEHASDSFECITLRTDTSEADQFYRHLGFLRVDEDTVTHRLPLRSLKLGEGCK
jgi:GNAT superfamily N-acetyltransferase